jgi:hypothetical protein
MARRTLTHDFVSHTERTPTLKAIANALVSPKAWVQRTDDAPIAKAHRASTRLSRATTTGTWSRSPTYCSRITDRRRAPRAVIFSNSRKIRDPNLLKNPRPACGIRDRNNRNIQDQARHRPTISSKASVYADGIERPLLQASDPTLAGRAQLPTAPGPQNQGQGSPVRLYRSLRPRAVAHRERTPEWAFRGFSCVSVVTPNAIENGQPSREDFG